MYSSFLPPYPSYDSTENIYDFSSVVEENTWDNVVITIEDVLD